MNSLRFPERDILKELDRREKRRNDPVRKAANKRAHKGPARRAANDEYHRKVVSPRKKATRHWMLAHPEIVEEIRRRHEHSGRRSQSRAK